MYLKKKDFLEWACVKISEYNLYEKDADAVCKFGEKERWRAKMQVLEDMKRLVQSGAFDADNTEIQRLRAALEKVKEELRWGDAENAIDRVEKIIDQALSTTTEPIGAAKVERVRELWNITKQRVDEPEDYLQQEYFAGKAIGIMDTLNALGIKILGINAPKGDGNDCSGGEV
jgi:hypothetical protein